MNSVEQDNDTLCGGCKQNNGTKRCGGCKKIYYCSQQCQAAHWKDHKTECKKIRKQNKAKQQKSKQNKSPNKKKKDELDNSFAMNMKKQYEKENKKRRTPRIKVAKAINGTFKVELLNEFLRNTKQNNLEFQFDYKLIDDEEWNTTYFSSSLLEYEKGVFAVRMPLNLNGYYIKCRLRAKLILDDLAPKWFDFSKEYKISIPSSMIGTEFDIGDIVRYKEENDYVLSWTQAVIIEKLPNGYLKLKEQKSTMIPQLKIKKDAFILHSSRVALPDNVDSRNLLDFSNLELDIDKTMLLKIGDGNIDDVDEKMKIYSTLITVYMKYATFWKLLCDKKNDNYCHCSKLESIAKYISKNVMEYLYEINEYEWKIDSCLLDHTHGALKCLECLRGYFIRRDIESKTDNKSKRKGMNEIDWRFQVCDLCLVSIDQFEYIYHCSTKMEDRHDICLNCIYSMIKQSGELKKLLIDMLTNNKQYHVNNDCIEVIVTFVVGKVVKV